MEHTYDGIEVLFGDCAEILDIVDDIVDITGEIADELRSQVTELALVSSVTCTNIQRSI